MFQVIRAIAVFIFIVVFLNACGGNSDGSSTSDGSNGSNNDSFNPESASDIANSNDGSFSALAVSGAQFYIETANGCVTCHGDTGRGGTFNAIDTVTPDTCPSCTDIDTLAQSIAATMPIGGTGNCVGNTPGTCAYDIAAFMLEAWIQDDIATPQILVTAPANPTTDESGATATIMLELFTEPTADVNIGVSSSNTAEGTVDTNMLTFTPANWDTPQSIVVTGVDDGNLDGPIQYTIVLDPAISADTDYSGMNPNDIIVTNLDNEVPPPPAGIIITPTSGLVTDETGLSTTFDIVLNSMPTDDVVIGLTSSDITEGTVSPSSLTFTSANYSLAQTVTVTGVDDLDVDGPIAYMIITSAATSLDPLYNMLDASDVSLTNNDNEVPPVIGVVVNPTSGLVTTEAGAGTATFNIRLESNPIDNVTIPLTSSNTAEGTVSPTSVTFTPANGTVNQTITVTGVDDAIDDDDVQYTIVTGDPTSAGDINYDALVAADVADVTVTNVDDDLSQLELGQMYYRQVFNTNDPNVTESCETCHGSAGLGNDPSQATPGRILASVPIAPGGVTCLVNCANETAFSTYTEIAMPRDFVLIGIGTGELPQNVCDQACADAIAAYVFNGFSTTP